MQDFDSKLIPIIREGIEIIRMVLFKEIQSQVKSTHAERDTLFCNMLTGAVLNEIFASANTEEPFATFNNDNSSIIEDEIANLAAVGEKVLIPLTDALRMQAICNRIERGEEVDDRPLLTADERGILLTDRDFPMPDSFLDMVRRIGSTLGLVTPPQAKKTAE